MSVFDAVKIFNMVRGILDVSHGRYMKGQQVRS